MVHYCCYESCHLPSASPTRILSPFLVQKLNSDEPWFLGDLETGAWNTSTTVDPILKAAIWED